MKTKVYLPTRQIGFNIIIFPALVAWSLITCNPIWLFQAAMYSVFMITNKVVVAVVVENCDLTYLYVY